MKTKTIDLAKCTSEEIRGYFKVPTEPCKMPSREEQLASMIKALKREKLITKADLDFIKLAKSKGYELGLEHEIPMSRKFEQIVTISFVKVKRGK